METLTKDPCDGKENYPLWKTGTFIEEWLKRNYPATRKYLTKHDQVQSYKDGWIVYNAEYIKCLSNQYSLPPLMLAGVAWKEVGGKPKTTDDLVFLGRTFDYHGNNVINKHFTIGKHPSLTSFGSVSMQLRRAAPYLGINPKDMSLDDLCLVIGELRSDVKNLELVAKHLVDLCKVDYDGINPLTFNDEQISVVCARYNIGPDVSIETVKLIDNYGIDIILKKNHILSLISL